MNEELKEKIKETLFTTISDIGEDKINTRLSDDDTQVISDIIEQTRSRLTDVSSEVMLVVLTGLLHYLLAESLIKSHRKITHKGMDLDIVIPNLNGLLERPENALVIAIVQDAASLQKKIDEIKGIQPNSQNIWVVSENTKHDTLKTFTIDDGTIRDILKEIRGFLAKQKPDPFKIHKI